MFFYWLQLYILALIFSIFLSLVDFIQVYVVHEYLAAHPTKLSTNLDNYFHESYLVLVCILACTKSYDLLFEVYKCYSNANLRASLQEQDHRQPIGNQVNITELPILPSHDVVDELQATNMPLLLRQIEHASNEIRKSRYLSHAINGRQYLILFWSLATNISFCIAVYSFKMNSIYFCLTSLSGSCLALQMIPRRDVRCIL